MGDTVPTAVLICYMLVVLGEDDIRFFEYVFDQYKRLEAKKDDMGQYMLRDFSKNKIPPKANS